MKIEKNENTEVVGGVQLSQATCPAVAVKIAVQGRMAKENQQMGPSGFKMLDFRRATAGVFTSLMQFSRGCTVYGKLSLAKRTVNKQNTNLYGCHVRKVYFGRLLYQKVLSNAV